MIEGCVTEHVSLLANGFGSAKKAALKDGVMNALINGASRAAVKADLACEVRIEAGRKRVLGFEFYVHFQ